MRRGRLEAQHLVVYKHTLHDFTWLRRRRRQFINVEHAKWIFLRRRKRINNGWFAQIGINRQMRSTMFTLPTSSRRFLVAFCAALGVTSKGVAQNMNLMKRFGEDSIMTE